MHFLRSVEKEKLVETFQEGFTANSPQKAPAQKANVDRLLATVADVKEGSVTTYTYVPGAGVVVNRDGKDVATMATSSTVTVSSAASPSTRKAMAMR